MKGTIFAVAALAATVSAQATANDDGTFTCAKAGASYCAGDSMKTNIIIRCNAEKKGQPGNCNDNLAGIPPVGVKTFAPCYQTSESAGDAVCSFDGVAHPDNGGEAFTIPGASPTGTDSYPSGTGSVTGSPSGTGDVTGSETGTATGSDYPSGTDSGAPYPTGNSTATDTDAPYPTGNSTATGTDGTDYPTATESGSYGNATATESDGGYATESAGSDYGNGTATGPSSPTGTNSAGVLRVGANLALGIFGLAAFFML